MPHSKHALFIALLIATQALAQASSTVNSVKTVDELLAIDNDNAVRKARARRFGEQPMPDNAAASFQSSGGVPVAKKDALPKLPEQKTVLAIYGTAVLRADLRVGAQVIEGVAVGSKIGPCVIAAVTAQRVEFEGGRVRCPSLLWTGEEHAFFPAAHGMGSELPAPPQPLPR